jgi:3'-phosphoadenosine 5'-phosphosulfate (PAPS) 3'-phosphatase
VIINAFGAEVWNAVHVSLVPHGPQTVAVVHCPARTTETWHREDRAECFYIRASNGTRELNGSSLLRYIREHWPT